MAKKLVVASLRDQLVDLIQEAIITNQYLPGQDLHIDKLAQQYGVSTTPVREALSRLQGAGLITMAPNRGPQVAPIRAQDVRDVWEMRKIMEPYAAVVAAQKCSDEEIHEIRQLLDRALDNPSDFSAYMTSDFELHDLLFLHIENQLFHDTLARFRTHSARIRYFAESGSERGRDIPRQVTSEHLLIVDALSSHDSAETARLVFEHLSNGLNRTLEAVESRSKVVSGEQLLDR